MSRLKELLASRTPAQVRRLSARTGLEEARILELRNGAAATLGEMRRLSLALRVDIDNLLGEPAAPLELLFRSAASQRSPGTAGRLASKVEGSYNLYSQAALRQALSWAGAFLEPEPSVAHAARNAEVFRRLFCGDDQLSPLLSLPAIAAERMNVLLFVVDERGIDGASAVVQGIPYIFVSARWPGRMLFTLAHEIGHLVAHHRDQTDFVRVDENVERPPSPKQILEEMYANAFASALLMPGAAVGMAIQAIRRHVRASQPELGDIEIGYLSRIFGVSFWAAARRCEDLELLPVGGAYALNQELEERFGSAEKRFEEVGLPPRPDVRFPKVPAQLLHAAVDSVRAGEMSVGKAATTLGVGISELYAANRPSLH